MAYTPRVTELRLVVTADDLEQAVRFYRDTLGMTSLAVYESENGRVELLDAGRATLEITDRAHAEFIDDVEVGRRVAGHIRVALEVDDSEAATIHVAHAGAKVIAQPTLTPWNSMNARVDAPAGMQLTLFTNLSDDEDWA